MPRRNIQEEESQVLPTPLTPRPGDWIREVTRTIVERECAACGDLFEVAHHRPDADYCRSSACAQARSRARLRQPKSISK